MFEVTTLDAHVAGGAVRLITAGLPHLDVTSLAGRQQVLSERAGPTLAALTREPRGHSGVVVVVLAEADTPDADAGLLFFRSSGAATPCGHALIGATGLAITRGVLAPRSHGTVRYDTMAGRMTATTVALAGSGAVPVRYTGPSTTVLRANTPINIGRRDLRADLVWSGTELVAIVDAEAAGVPLVSSRALELQRAGVGVVRHLDESIRVAHPETSARLSIASAIFIGPAPESGVDIRSASVRTDGAVELTPGGGATASIAAVLSAMGLLTAGRRLVHQSLIGTTLWATILSLSDVEGRPTVDVEIGGESWPTGDHVFRFDEADPLLSNDWDA
jgi:proline racemase